MNKKRILLANTRGIHGAAHLIQRCRDSQAFMSFAEMTKYLRENSMNIEGAAPQSRKRIMHSTEESVVEEQSIEQSIAPTSKVYLTLKETSDLFAEVARESTIYNAYKSFNSTPIRQSMRIHPDIWKQLSSEIQEKISAIKAELYEKRSSQPPLPPAPGNAIPSQYPSMRKANKAATVPTETQVYASLCAQLGEMTTMDSDDEWEGEDQDMHINMCIVDQPEDDNTITVRAHLEYTQSGDKQYAISDSGADSSILGKYAHVISHTGRFAYLVGYDPSTTRSAKIPIVSGYIKVMSQVDIPIVLKINEAPYNAHSPITLLSEYQARDYGTIIDSVSSRHKTIHGTYGTQRMLVSRDVYVPFVDRGGLMGFEVLPWKEGDEEIYDVFTITSDNKWTPRRYIEDQPDSIEPVHDVFNTETKENLDASAIEGEDVFKDAHQVLSLEDEFFDVDNDPQVVVNDDNSSYDLSITSDISLLVQQVTKGPPLVISCEVFPYDTLDPPAKPYYYDPSDEDKVSLGQAVPNLLSVPSLSEASPAEDLLSYLTYRELTGFDEYDGYYDGYPAPDAFIEVPANLLTSLFTTMEPAENAFDSRMFVVASWHRVLHKNLEPKQLQPYLGFAPLKVIKRTLERTTQMARMIIRSPLRRHIKSRLAFMRAKRLEETVSTDPMFANCRGLGYGYTGAQVFYGLKSHKIDVYGFRRKGEFPHIYRDFIKDQGAPSALRRDNAKEEQSEAVDEIHRELYIKDEFCEPYNPQQNPVESRGIKYLKEHVHTLLDRTGAPDAAWFHAAQYLAGVHSILSNAGLPGKMCPQQFRTGVTPDISPWLQFTFWQPILYLDNENTWPASKERSGYWLGVADNIGDLLTYWIFDDQSHQVLARSVVRPFRNNRRVKWDPALCPTRPHVTAQHGGDIKPPGDFIAEKLRDLEDVYDKEESEPDPHYFDALTDCPPTRTPVDKGSVYRDRNTSYFDTEVAPGELSPFVPTTLKDSYKGPSQLRLTRFNHGLDNSIPHYPMKGKKDYLSVEYPIDYAPPEQEITVELPSKKKYPTRERKTEPVQDVVPKVKGIRGTSPLKRRSSRLAGKKNEEPLKSESKFIGKAETSPRTKWTPSKIIKGLAAAAVIGVSLLPTAIIAEPCVQLVDFGETAHFSDPMALKPMDTSNKLECLRAYHARLDMMNEIESPDESKSDWHALYIEKFLVKPREDDSKDIRFKVQWHGGEKSWVKMDDLRLHDPLLVLRYGLRNKLTRSKGWEWVETFVNNDQELSRIIHAYKVSKEISYKFGVRVPKNTQEALRLDSAADEKLWSEAVDIELKQINDYETFRVLEDNERLPFGYKKIPYHCVFDVKFDGRRKCRLVAGGHRTDPPKEDIFSGVVSMEAVRLGFILARLNGLLVCAGDVGNAFLYGKTNEKVFVIAGPEFGVHQGKRMIVDRSLYGLKSSAARFHEHLSIKLRKLGFKPSKADPDLWIRKIHDHYEYIARFVDDVIVFSKDPMAIMKELEKNYVMKGVGKPQYYLGGDVVELQEPWDKEGIYTAFSAETYIKNCLPKLKAMCGVTEFKKVKTPFAEDYHPELELSELLSPPEISKYKSLIGSGNWLITLGRFDIQFAISTLSQY